jgi:ABC-type uncharacterized transport system involved in gliding motility auxiliary subunit
MKETVTKIVAVVGLVLLIAGAVFFTAASAGNEWPGVLFFLGVFLLVGSALVNMRALVAFSKRRSARHGANAILMTVLFTAILVIVQAISIRHTRRYDVTKNKRFTLSEQTVSILERIDDDIQITAFFRKFTAQRLEAKNLLDLYALQNRRITYAFIDPDQQPHIAERFRARNGEVVVEYKDHQRKIDELTEEKLTNSIVFSLRDIQKTIYFTTGHDEKRIESRDRSGLNAARRSLEEEGFTTHEISLLEVDSVPPDCSVLVLAGPKKEFLQNEADKVDVYLAGGGNALFLLDPRWPINRIESILTRYHVELENVVLLDELVIVDAGEEVFDATYTKIRRYERHPITRDFRSVTIFPMARPISIAPVEGDRSVRIQILAVTEKSVWGETDLNSFKVGSATRDELDVPPPLAVAAVAVRTNNWDAPPGAAQSNEIKSKIVVIGDSDFATNRFFGVLGNSDFFLNAVEYLAEEEIVIPIRLTKDLGDRMFISAAEGRFVFLLCLVLMPLMVASMGGYIFLKKRKS